MCAVRGVVRFCVCKHRERFCTDPLGAASCSKDTQTTCVLRFFASRCKVHAKVTVPPFSNVMRVLPNLRLRTGPRGDVSC